MVLILDGDWLREAPGCPGLQREALPLPGSALPSGPPAPRRPPPGSAPLPMMVAGGHWEQTSTLCLFWKTAEGGTAASADGQGGARMPAPTFPNVPSPLHGGGGSPRGSRGLSAETGPPAWSLCPGASCLLCHWAPTLPGWASPGRPGAHSRPHSFPREASPCLPPTPERRPAVAHRAHSSAPVQKSWFLPSMPSSTYEVRREGREPLPDHAGESPLLSRSGGDAAASPCLSLSRCPHHFSSN